MLGAVADDSSDPPDGVWIDATGGTYLHGGETPMLSLLSEHLAWHGLTGRAVIADTPAPRTGWHATAT